MSSSQTSSSSSDTGDSLSPMFDVKCRVEVILGNTSLSVRNCLRLERQSIVRLHQSAGSDLEVRVQGVTVATGEVVILDDNTALRISRVAPPAGVEAS
jgi:flagellar motor switch protein FliN/FliY